MTQLAAVIVSTSIISACKKKQEQGYCSLYKLSLPYVYSIVKRYIYQEEERKDLVQEVYAQVFQQIGQFDPDKGSFKFWLRKIAVNICLMHIRKEKRFHLLVPLEHIDENKYAEELRFDSLSKEMIRRLLDKMPKGYRTIFLLVVIDDFSHAEVGNMLGISPETSRSQLSRAKIWIRNKLQQDIKLQANGFF